MLLRFVSQQIPSFVKISPRNIIIVLLSMSEQCCNTLASNLAYINISGKRSDTLLLKCFTLKLKAI